MRDQQCRSTRHQPPQGAAILGMVGQDWNCRLFDSVSDATIEGKAVLIRS